MDSSDEDVIIACGLYLPSEEEKRKKTKNFLTQNFSLGEGGTTLSLYTVYVLFQKLCYKDHVVSTT
jgi:hypothetical protein